MEIEMPDYVTEGIASLGFAHRLFVKRCYKAGVAITEMSKTVDGFEHDDYLFMVETCPPDNAEALARRFNIEYVFTDDHIYDGERDCFWTSQPYSSWWEPKYIEVSGEVIATFDDYDLEVVVDALKDQEWSDGKVFELPSWIPATELSEAGFTLTTIKGDDGGSAAYRHHTALVDEIVAENGAYGAEERVTVIIHEDQVWQRVTDDDDDDDCN
jgi:hypothetical protein